jgi:hypothetical protein
VADWFGDASLSGRDADAEFYATPKWAILLSMFFFVIMFITVWGAIVQFLHIQLGSLLVEVVFLGSAIVMYRGLYLYYRQYLEGHEALRRLQ